MPVLSLCDYLNVSGQLLSSILMQEDVCCTMQALEKLELDAATAAVLLNNAAAEGLAGASLGAQPKARIKEALRRLDTLMEKAAGPSQTVAAALQTRLSSGQQETILCNRSDRRSRPRRFGKLWWPLRLATCGAAMAVSAPCSMLQ